jgi:nucleoside-triphosphatase
MLDVACRKKENHRKETRESVNVLLTGRPGIGKTTLIKRLIEVSSLSKGGFYTEEVREKGQRVGFSLITLDGKRSLLAHLKTKSPYRVGRYGVDIDTFEAMGVESIRKAISTNDIIIIDEIGRMELFSRKFREVVFQALKTGRVVATIKKGRGDFIDRIKSRKDVRVLKVNLENRETLSSKLTKIVIDLRNRPYPKNPD